MHDTSLALAPIPTDIGPVTSVDALLQEIEAESGNSSAPSRSEPPVAAGVNAAKTQGQGVKVPPQLRPPAPPPALSGKAKDLGPVVTLAASASILPSGTEARGVVDVTWPINERTTVKAELAERLRDPFDSQKDPSLATRGSLEIMTELYKGESTTFTGKVQAYVQHTQPLGNGDPRLQIGARLGFDVIQKLGPEISVAGGLYGDLSRTLPDTDAIRLGGTMRISFQPKSVDRLSLNAGVSGEADVSNSVFSSAAFVEAAVKLNKGTSLSLRVTGGLDGRPPALNPQFPGEGLGVTLGLTHRF